MRYATDPSTPRYRLPVEQLPRGFVPWPEPILKTLEKEQVKKGFRFAPEYVKSTLERQTLEYYYEGLDVAYRPAEGGIEVLAVGFAEANAYRNDPTVKVVQA